MCQLENVGCGRQLGRRTTALMLVVLLCAASLAGLTKSSAAQSDQGVTTLTGTVSFNNPAFGGVLTEPYMLLLDLTAFVKRDRSLPATLASQVMGPVEGDLTAGATYQLNLPIAPKGTVNDVAHGSGAGVQVYSVEFNANAFGDPFAGPDELAGWGSAVSSLAVAIGTDEVTGGELVVFAPDENEQFPTGFGADDKLFTADDPVGPIQSGWTVVDLNTEPFARLRDASVEVPIIPGDEGFFDYRKLSFTEAFDKLLGDLEVRYPFTVLKGIDWNALRGEFRPKVEAAQEAGDALAFNEALVDFSLRFSDGHVGVNTPPEYIAAKIGGRLGMRLAETNDGRVIVISVTQGLPADRAGIKLGAEVDTWNGKPVKEAVGDVQLVFTASSDFARRLQRYEFLTRGPMGGKVQVTFVNPDGAEETKELTFGADIEGRDFAANTRVDVGDVNDGTLPVDAKLLDSGIGYVRISTFDVDPVLLSHAWEWALTNFQALGATGLIVDIRDNSGGLGSDALYVAGSFYDQSFDLFDSYFNDANGTPVNQGASRVDPSAVRWTAPVAVLIDEGCLSACEIFAAAMTHGPGHLLVGYTPTAGVEASVYFWSLPGNVFFNAPVGALKSGDQIFLEGAGVSPNVAIPASAENLLDPGDEVLAKGEEALGAEIAKTQTPAEASPVPAVGSPSPVVEGTPSV